MKLNFQKPCYNFAPNIHMLIIISNIYNICFPIYIRLSMLRNNFPHSKKKKQFFLNTKGSQRFA